MTEPGSYADVNGLHLYFERHGSGDPVVLLHGGAMTIPSAWSGLLPVLARDHEVVAIEPQAHGRTADIDRDFTPANNDLLEPMLTAFL